MGVRPVEKAGTSGGADDRGSRYCRDRAAGTRDGTADAALEQIEDRGYALPYAADPRKLIKIGANFDSKTRILDEWKVV